MLSVRRIAKGQKTNCKLRKTAQHSSSHFAKLPLALPEIPVRENSPERENTRAANSPSFRIGRFAVRAKAVKGDQLNLAGSSLVCPPLINSAAAERGAQGLAEEIAAASPLR